MKYLFYILSIFLFFWISTFTNFHYRFQIFHGIIFLSLMLGAHLHKRFGALSGATFVYLILSGSLNSTYPVSPYLKMGPNWINAVDILSSHSMVFLLMILVTVLLVESFAILNGLAILAFLNSIYIIGLSVFWPGPKFAGIMLNLSMDATFIVVLYPYLLHKTSSLKPPYKMISRIIPVIAIFLTQSSIGVGALAIVMFLKFVNVNKYLKYLIPISIIIFAYLYDPNLFDSNMRFENYQRSMTWWNEYANHYLGTGVGTYWKIGQYIHKINEPSAKLLFIFMHSDWLQVIFELGYIGFILIFSLFINILYKSFKRPWIFSSALVFGAVSLFNMPTKYILTAVFGMVIVKLSLDKEKQDENN